MKTLDVVELSITDMLQALNQGEVTAVDLVCAYLNRIGYYDRTGACLHALVVLNPRVFEEAQESDARRRRGEAGSLEGVPFTVKDSYKVKGLTVAAGSPALEDLVSNEDAASVAMLRAAGAVLIGKTNMPPMASGGVQPGAYDYARSPYNPDYLTAAFGSGSSNGSGTATASNMCAFGMAEETVSSGRSPASNNALVAYTPSRGVLSIRGNWPLRPTCDVVVPHTRTVADLEALLEVLARTDDRVDGDFWREQHAVALPAPEEVIAHPVVRERPSRLDGVRLGIPRMFIGEDDEAAEPPVLRRTVRALWDRAAEDLTALGAEVIPVDFPMISNYEEDRPGTASMERRGLVPRGWRGVETGTVAAMALDRFLRSNGDPALGSWVDVDADRVFPAQDAPVGVWMAKARGAYDWLRLAEFVRGGLPKDFDEVEGLPEILRGLEETRRRDLEEWMESLGLDALVFPAAGDVAMSDVFTRAESLEHAARNGVIYSNGNRALRHLGVPTVSVPMGSMADISMPVNLTFAGAAYTDDRLLSYAHAYEAATRRRESAYLAPTIPSGTIDCDTADTAELLPLSAAHSEILVTRGDWGWDVRVSVPAAADHPVRAWADGQILTASESDPTAFTGRISYARPRLFPEALIVVKVGRTAAALSFAVLPGA